jgi:hypothetical protein
MSLEAKILSLHERITEFEWIIRARQNSTGWDDAIKDLIMRRDRLLERHKAMKAEHEAAKTAEHEAKKAAHKARRPNMRLRCLCLFGEDSGICFCRLRLLIMMFVILMIVMMLCLLVPDDPFSNLSVSREHLRAMDAVVRCIEFKKKNLVTQKTFGLRPPKSQTNTQTLVKGCTKNHINEYKIKNKKRTNKFSHFPSASVQPPSPCKVKRSNSENLRLESSEIILTLKHS